jgi:transposase
VSVWREHRRAKSDRLDVGVLKRLFLGWRRGEKKHCSLVAVPTREEEDGKRPLRERLVSEATRLVNRMKGLLALHGIVKFDVRAKTALQRPAGAPDESGSKRREQGLAKAGNARVRRALIQLAWRFLRHPPDSALVKWFRQRTQDGRSVTRKTMIPAFARTALARKLLIVLWELVTTGVVPAGVRMPAAI